MSRLADDAAPPVLRLAGASKTYGGVHALRQADLTIAKGGSVHGLIGQNGSGKSTLLSILSGQTNSPSGSFEVGGVSVSFSSPVDAIKAGIGMVSQETALALDLTVTENVLLGRRLVRAAWGIDWPRSHARAAEVLRRLDLLIEPAAIVSTLSPDQRQMVEIARALSQDTRILILDEPTSSLNDDEVRSLFKVVRQLTTGGVSTILVTHRLPELFEMCDELTVLRDGRTVAAGPISEFTPESLIDLMVGAGATENAAPHLATSRATGKTAIELRSVNSGLAVKNVSITARSGEIVGLVGLVGAGRSELLKTVFGMRPYTGSIIIDGSPRQIRRPSDAIRLDIGYLPPDRKTEGVVLKMSVRDNMTMVATNTRPRLLRPKSRALYLMAARVARQVRLRAPQSSALVGQLSGGNQQKVALGKWLVEPPRVLLLDEPTRGVDVAAKAEIHDVLSALADSGVAMIVSSSENDELMTLCDRLLVMFRGEVVADLSRDDASEALIARLAGGDHDD